MSASSSRPQPPNTPTSGQAAAPASRRTASACDLPGRQLRQRRLRRGRRLHRGQVRRRGPGQVARHARQVVAGHLQHRGQVGQRGGLGAAALASAARARASATVARLISSAPVSPAS